MDDRPRNDAHRPEERKGARAAPLLFLLALGLVGQPAAGAQINVSSASVAPGDSFTLEVSLTTGPGEAIAAVSVEIAFDSTVFTPPPTCTISPSIESGTAADKFLVESLPSPGVLRAGILGLNSNAIPDGDLFSCQFTTSPSAASGEFVLASSAGASTPTGSSAQITGGFGTVTVTGGPDTDGDGIMDPVDNCIQVPNPLQIDTDGDGCGNTCDADFNNDGTVGLPDFGLLSANFGQAVPPGNPLVDLNGDGAIGIPDFGLFSAQLGGPPGPGVNCP